MIWKQVIDNTLYEPNHIDFVLLAEFMGISGQRNVKPSDDFSHEGASEYEKAPKTSTPKKKTSTPSILPPIGATTSEMVANQVSFLWLKIM